MIWSAALLEDSEVVATGAGPKMSLPIGVIVATGGICTTESAPGVGCAAVVGNTAVLVVAQVCVTESTVFLSDGDSGAVCTVSDVACWVAIV